MGSLALVVVGSLVIGFLTSPRRHPHDYRISDEERAKLDVVGFVHGYDRWRRTDEPASPCPSVLTLDEFTNSSLADPWSTFYRIECGAAATSIRVVSAGPDQRFGTSDDITSDPTDGGER